MHFSVASVFGLDRSRKIKFNSLVMPCKMFLRWDQSYNQRKLYSIKDRAVVFAPIWVRNALQILGQRLAGIKFELYDNNSSPFHTAPAIKKPVETFEITENFNDQNLLLLQKIARNEPSNVTGEIDFTLYPDIKEKLDIISIRDLVRQCVIVGVDECSTYGGYRCPHQVQPKQRVYVCDLAALQFQRPYNSGRLVLIQDKQQKPGIIDDLIYQNVVGERKRSYQEVLALQESDEFKLRYIPHDGFGAPGQKTCFLDTWAYRRFVAQDVVLSGLALSEMASSRGDKIIFKFLKYGTGFFAGRFQPQLEQLILYGVVDGLMELFGAKNPKVEAAIKHVELPFFQAEGSENIEKLVHLELNYGIKVSFSTDDALKQKEATRLQRSGQEKLYVVATTNCGDNHAAFGNEMGFSSVDAAIAENLASKGNFLCPNINTAMGAQYLDIRGINTSPANDDETSPQCSSEENVKENDLADADAATAEQESVDEKKTASNENAVIDSSQCENPSVAKDDTCLEVNPEEMNTHYKTCDASVDVDFGKNK